MYVLDKDGKRIYTLKKVLDGKVTKSAHPARFSPDDKYSRFVLYPYPVSVHTPSRHVYLPSQRNLGLTLQFCGIGTE